MVQVQFFFFPLVSSCIASISKFSDIKPHFGGLWILWVLIQMGHCRDDSFLLQSTQELAELSVDGLRWPDNWLGLPRSMAAFRLLSPYRALSTSVPVNVVKVLVPYDPDSGVRSLGATPSYSFEWNLLPLCGLLGGWWVYFCMWRNLNTLLPCFCMLHIIWGWDGVRCWQQSQGCRT